ncbi:MAG TPA: hypothetical protein VLN74_06900 [Ilumatobacteraceae bacterium]|nr:hypothetical protein [Ilumatobacteraceae bacterium]
MRHSPSTTSIGLVSILAVAGLLAGCAGGDGDGDGAASESTLPTVATTVAVETTMAASDAPSTDAPVETDPPATDPPVTDPPATDPPATEAPAGDAGDGECLIGNWVVTEAQMDGYYAGLMGTLDAPISLDTSGSAPLSFGADGTYEWAPGFALAVEVAGQSGNGEVAGTITGDWTAVDGVVTTSSDVNALTVSISVNGVAFDGDDLANGLLNSSPVNGVTYSCDGPTPVLDFQTADPAVTVPVTLTPA